MHISIIFAVPRGEFCEARSAWLVLRSSFCVACSAWLVLRGSFCVARSAWLVLRGSFCISRLLSLGQRTSFQRRPRRSIFQSVPIQIQNYSASGSTPLFNDALAVRFSNRYRSKFKITQPRAAHLFSTTPSPFDFPIGTDPNSKLLSLGRQSIPTQL